MNWNKQEVGKALQSARLRKGWTLDEVGEMAGMKPQVVSALERGIRCRPPHMATQAKLERTLGIELPIIREAPKTVTIYVSADKAYLIKEVETKWPEKSRGWAIMAALQAWSEHREALRIWNASHPGANLEV